MALLKVQQDVLNSNERITIWLTGRAGGKTYLANEIIRKTQLGTQALIINNHGYKREYKLNELELLRTDVISYKSQPHHIIHEAIEAEVVIFDCMKVDYDLVLLISKLQNIKKIYVLTQKINFIPATLPYFKSSTRDNIFMDKDEIESLYSHNLPISEYEGCICTPQEVDEPVVSPVMQEISRLKKEFECSVDEAIILYRISVYGI